MAREVAVLKAHRGAAYAVAFARDGRHLVSAGADGDVCVFSIPAPSGAPDAKEAARFKGHRRAVHGLSFDATGERLATCAPAEGVRIWSFPAGKGLRVLEDQADAAFAPCGHHLAMIARNTSDKPLTLWEADTLTVLRRFAPVDKRHLTLAFAPNGSILFIGGSGPIHRLALPDGTSEGVQRGHEIAVACLRASPNGAVLASSGVDGKLFFWTVVGGDEVHRAEIGAAGPPGSFQLAFAPDGRTLAVSCQGEVRLFGAPDGNLKKSIQVGVDGVFGVDISPDGRWLANAAEDGNVRLYELP